MARPRPPIRQGNINHLAEALAGLEEVERSIARIQDGLLSTDARAAVQRLSKSVKAAKSAAGDGIVALSGGTLARGASTAVTFSQQEQH